MQKIDFPYKAKRYKHIDKRLSFNKVKKYVMNPEKIAKHSFLPFLHYKLIFEKFLGYSYFNNGENKKIKERDIYYAAHMDSYIYRYYADKLNDLYNDFTAKNGIDEVATAYRNNKPGKSNINHAAEVIAKINSYKSALIIVGDFTSFFDELDHSLLKERLQKVLAKSVLPTDWYNIFRSITKFGYLEKESLENSQSELVKKDKDSFSYFEKIKDFWKYKKGIKVKRNTNNYGIPQGNALSGILANIYSIDFDFNLLKLANEYNGIYRRYSDDFILVLDAPDLEIDTITDKILLWADNNKIKLQPDKTKQFKLVEGKICTLDLIPASIDYLGFKFDGHNVKMREKSIYKFYRNARKLIFKSKKLQEKLGLSKIPNRYKIYALYTDFGYSNKYPSNFISYAKRSQKIFDKVSPETNNLMLNQIKNRKKKIEKALGYKIHSRV